MTPARRRMILGGAVIVLFAAVEGYTGVGREDARIAEAVAGPAARASARPATEVAASNTAVVALAMPRREPFAGQGADAFQTRNWAPVVPAAKPDAAAPALPPLPYAYIGRMLDENVATVFLARGEQVYTVAAGAVLDDTYRVEEIGRSAVVLTYLPLRRRQVLDIGEID